MLGGVKVFMILRYIGVRLGFWFGLNEVSILKILIDAFTEQLAKLLCIGSGQAKGLKDMILIHHLKFLVAC